MRLLLCLLPLLLCCHCREKAPALVGSADGLQRTPAHNQPPLPDVLIAPDGTRVVPGTTDELGYVLPLDVLRPKSERPAGVRPVPQAAPLRRGGGFTETRLGIDDGHTQNETALDADGDVVIAGWNQATAGSIVMGVGRSTDGGDNWTWDSLTGHSVMSDPTIAAGGAGRWYYGYLGTDLAGSDIEIYVSRSDDDGLTWQPPVAVTNNSGFDDKPYIAARGDVVLAAWADFGFSPAKVSAAVSLNGGTSFVRHVALAQNSQGGNGACPVIGPDGTLYVFWRDSFQQFLWVSHSADNGLTWSQDRQVAPMSPLPSSLPPGFRIVNLPAAAADPNTGDLVVVWNDQAMGDADILAVRSGDGGFTWSSPVRVNDDASGHPQFFPWIDVDPTGTMHVMWYDMRGNGSDIDVYYSASTDGGATFAPNERITASAFTPILPWEGGLASFIGDYNGIAASDARVYAFYQDSRRGEQDVYVAAKDLAEVLTYPEALARWPEVTVLDLLPLIPVP